MRSEVLTFRRNGARKPKPSFIHSRSVPRIVRQGKLFQKWTHILYFSVLSLRGNINTRRMSKPEMGSIRWNILVIGNYYVNYQNFQNLMLLTSSDTKRTLMHLFLFTNSPPKRTGFYMYTINFPCIAFLHETYWVTLKSWDSEDDHN